MKTKLKIIFLVIILGIIFFIFSPKSKAASLSIKASNNNPTVGDTITITISGGDGIIKSVTSSDTSKVTVGTANWVDREGTTIVANAIAPGSATIRVVPEEVLDKDEQPITSTASITINVKAKETTTSSSGSSTSTNSNSSNSSKSNASNQSNTNKEKVKNVEETEQEEEATPQFGMNSLMLNGIKENGEKQEIEFTPTFNIDTYEYSCNISEEIKDIEVLTEAGEYNDYVKIEKPEEFVEGENIIKITMSKDGTDLTYTIKVIKETSTETTQEVENQENKQQNNQSAIIAFTIPQFIGIVLAICLIEGVILKMPWKKLCGKRKEKNVSDRL